MKWVIIKGVRYPSSVISAFAAYNMDNPFLKVRIRNKYHIVPFDDVNKMVSQMVYLMDNYPDFVQIGIWLCIQKLVSLENLGMARYFILSFRFDKNECEALLDKNDPNDKMNEFIDGFIFNRNNHIKKLDDIGYHKIGEVFKYDIGSGIIELAVIEDDGSGCDGCIFNDRNYYCKNTCCINVDRKDSTDIIYKEVKRS